MPFIGQVMANKHQDYIAVEDEHGRAEGGEGGGGGGGWKGYAAADLSHKLAIEQIMPDQHRDHIAIEDKVEHGRPPALRGGGGVGGGVGASAAADLSHKLAIGQIMPDQHRDDIAVEDEVEHGRAAVDVLPEIWAEEVDVHEVLQGGRALHPNACRCPH